MFYSQKKIYCIDKENEEVIVSFKDYDLIFKIIGYKGGFRMSYDRETDTIDRNVENIFLCEKSKNKNYTIKTPLDFVKEEVFTFKNISSITLSLENFYIVTIYEVWEEDIVFDVKVKINFKTG